MKIDNIDFVLFRIIKYHRDFHIEILSFEINDIYKSLLYFGYDDFNKILNINFLYFYKKTIKF